MKMGEVRLALCFPFPLPAPVSGLGLPAAVASGVLARDWGRAFFLPLPPEPEMKLRNRFFSLISYLSCLLMNTSSVRSSCPGNEGSRTHHGVYIYWF